MIKLNILIIIALISTVIYSQTTYEMAVCELQPFGDSTGVSGTIYFYLKDVNTKRYGMAINAKGLTGTTNREISVREYGNYSYPGGMFTTSQSKVFGCPDGTNPSSNLQEGSLGSVSVNNGEINENKDYIDQFTLKGESSLIGRTFVINENNVDCNAQDPNNKIVANCVIGIANGAFVPTGNPAATVYQTGYINDAQSTSDNLKRAICEFTDISGSKVDGIVYFDQVDSEIQVTAKVTGLDKSIAHGFHIHQYGDLTLTNGSSVGLHWKTSTQTHALPPNNSRELGDLGNICAFDYQGDAYYSYKTDYMGLFSSNSGSVIGHAVVIHASRDNGTENSYGGRLAQCTIGYERNDNETPKPPTRVDLSTTPTCDKVTIAPTPSSTTSSTTASLTTSSTTASLTTTAGTTTGDSFRISSNIILIFLTISLLSLIL